MSKTETINQLKELSSKLSITSNLFAGVNPHNLTIPKNIICFQPSLLHETPTHHHRFVLVINIKSSGHISLDQHIFPLEPSQAILFFPFQQHHYFGVAKNPKWLFITFELDKPDNLLSLKNKIFPLSDIPLINAVDILQEYQKCSQKKDNGSRLSLLMSMFLERLQSSTRIESKPLNYNDNKKLNIKLLEQVNKFIYRSLGRPFSIDNVADHCGISASHLRLLFRKHFGISLGAFIRNSRINRACELLSNSDLNISEIAEACGYDSLYAFSRAFKKQMAVSPRHYRKRQA